MINNPLDAIPLTDLLAASGVIPMPAIPPGTIKVYVCQNAGNNKAWLSTNLNEVLARLEVALTDAVLTRYEVTIAYMLPADYATSPDVMPHA